MTDFHHDACELFKTRCHERGITTQHISVSRRPKVRRPDFAIQIDGKTVIVEVKALEPNKQAERCKSDASPDIKRISKKLRKADRQLRPFAKRGIPGIVNITDYTHQGLFLVPGYIHNAMFGDDKLRLSVQRGRTYPPPLSAGHETLTPQNNTSTSALLIFRRKLPSRTFVSFLFHNLFAQNPIPPECAAHFVDYQYESREREWIEIAGSDPASP